MPDLDYVNGYYGSCHRCQEPQAALFRRPFGDGTTWDLCQSCIATLELERPVGAFDQGEEEEEGDAFVDERRVIRLLVGAMLVAMTVLWVAAEIIGGSR
jgi:hypothetical protein